jgi:hypothetical protein
MSLSDSKELLRVDGEYVSIKEFAEIQGVKEATVVRWINTAKLKYAKLDRDTWLIPVVHARPQRNAGPADYLLDVGLKIDEYPFVQFSENIFYFEDDDSENYTCVFMNFLTEFREEMTLTKEETERLEYLLIASGKARKNGY